MAWLMAFASSLYFESLAASSVIRICGLGAPVTSTLETPAIPSSFGSTRASTFSLSSVTAMLLDSAKRMTGASPKRIAETLVSCTPSGKLPRTRLTAC